jgi:hypothetical protein
MHPFSCRLKQTKVQESLLCAQQVALSGKNNVKRLNTHFGFPVSAIYVWVENNIFEFLHHKKHFFRILEILTINGLVVFLTVIEVLRDPT